MLRGLDEIKWGGQEKLDSGCRGLTGAVPGSLSAGKVLGVCSALMDRGGISSTRPPAVLQQQVSAGRASTAAHPRCGRADWNRRIRDTQANVVTEMK